MNRITLLIIVAAIVLSTVSCGQKTQKQTTNDNEQKTATQQTEEVQQAVEQATNLSKDLYPTEIGEFATPDNNSESDTYPYRSDPNGKYYHFEPYVGDGDSQWDAISRYEEIFTATSTLAPSGNTRYDAKNLQNGTFREDHGGNREVTWCEGVKGYGIGERINMSVRTKTVTEGNDEELCFWWLMIVNGYARNATTWENNSRVKTLRLYVGGNYWCDLHLEDVIKPQEFQLPEHLYIYPGKVGKIIPEKGAFSKPIDNSGYQGDINKPVYQTDLTFEIIDVYPGKKYDDTCITGIALTVSGGIY